LIDISRAFEVNISQVSHWAKVAGRVRRTRGARKSEEPSDHVKAVMRMAARMPYSQVADIVGTSRQNVCEIYNAWIERWWKIEPLKVGDLITWYGVNLKVLAVHDHSTGDVQTEDGKMIKSFRWRIGNNRSRLATTPAR
jgi:hypothetical protein